MCESIHCFGLQDETNRVVFGAEVPSAWLQALNPLICVSCMPLLTGLWSRQAPLTWLSLGCQLRAYSQCYSVHCWPLLFRLDNRAT